MRAAIIALAVVGAILLLGGIAALASSFQPLSDSATITIPSGAQWYYAYDFSLLANGHVSGSFQERTGGSVDVYVLTDAQYKVYDGGGSPQPLFYTAGSSGQLDVALPGSDTFHLVFDHGAGYDAVQQDVDVVITVSGIGPPTYFIAGVVALGIGTLFIVLAAWKERRDKLVPRAMYPPMQPNVPSCPPPAWGPLPQPFTPPEQPPTPPDQGPPSKPPE
ncbi:MAG TPA: hypothetical protein VEM77_02770 [Thermoplasmata archaeon]|nr:hypothetical protein [Thermoplasmata archaeon]